MALCGCVIVIRRKRKIAREQNWLQVHPAFRPYPQRRAEPVVWPESGAELISAREYQAGISPFREEICSICMQE